MPFTLQPLPYAHSALEPHIDAQTMEIHHDKHHAAYVNNANKALEGTPWADLGVWDLLPRLGELPQEKQTPVRNNAGGHANHTLFWRVIGPNAGGKPSGDLARVIDRDLGGFEKFKEAFANAGATRFGSGWAWLVVKDGKLAVCSTANQDNPLMPAAFGGGQGTPILGLDVWEHAYYLKYQNRRPDYIKAFWNVVNWDEVSRRFVESGARV
ncbi:MAG: superoxide dismutase [Mn] [Leptolyngbya sp. PLA3]|nr:MAG: superoxide dismutase [Mn] [Cyanobacteria bacterium CYA]MCE7969751.1 superoxide dismutase [Mn] [Leptolyngbya sp. PL-A3]